MIEYLYTDGGCIGPNPSAKGGTWCFCQVSELDELIDHRCGVITPEDIGLTKITNNLVELLAAIRALESVPKDWQGMLCTDSKVTMFRLTHGNGFKGIPFALRHRVLNLRRNRRYKVRLLAGHPTQKELEAGWARGSPVSKWNVFCDEKCTELSKTFAP